MTLALASAYPDARFTVEDMIAEGDQVVTKKTFSGTNTGEFAGMPATGRAVSVQYVDIMRVHDGRIVEHWLSMDRLVWFQQLGLAPA
jgi:predicted ester cyclase